MIIDNSLIPTIGGLIGASLFGAYTIGAHVQKQLTTPRPHTHLSLVAAVEPITSEHVAIAPVADTNEHYHDRCYTLVAVDSSEANNFYHTLRFASHERTYSVIGTYDLLDGEKTIAAAAIGEDEPRLIEKAIRTSVLGVLMVKTPTTHSYEELYQDAHRLSDSAQLKVFYL